MLQPQDGKPTSGEYVSYVDYLGRTRYLPGLRRYDLDEIADDILLSMTEGVGALTTARLLNHFGNATNVLNASANELRQVAKIGETVATRIQQTRRVNDVGAVIQFCRENDVHVLVERDIRYPMRLRQIDNPPPLLYMRGEIAPEDFYAIAIVGTRKATAYGLKQAERIASELVKCGFTIISGLALGIDGAAHRASLNSKGRTIAVLGGGVARIYPREHEDLAGRVIMSGALLSEYHPLAHPSGGNFPARNRIVSGMAVGVLVVESPVKSGSLITADFALEQNREVFAVPGAVDSASSRGCHELIKQGAVLVENAQDIINALAPYDLPPQALQTLKERRQETTASPFEPGAVGITKSSIERIAREPKKKGKPTRARRDAPEGQTALPLNNAANAPSAPNEQVVTKASDATPVFLTPKLPLTENEQRAVEALRTDAIEIEELAQRLEITTFQALALVTSLEFKGAVQRYEGNVVSRLAQD
ncbi:MAG: DNA-processing protein DprA [Planctomycetia bacterium]|nr:DNA-processing protein DprA [Planctomycetia bacterium]